MMVHETDYQISLLEHPSLDILFSEEVSKVVSRVTFHSNEGAVHILADWQKAIESHLMYSGLFHVPCKVQSPTDHIGYYVEYYLHQVFLALNLAAPGCCTFYGTTINRDNNPVVLAKSLALRGYAGKPYSLSSSDFWPAITSIPPSDAWTWVQAISSPIRQVAQTKAERALFAMLHVSKEESLSPNRLIWLAHALEALFDTPELGISKALKDRIFLVLGSPATHLKKIRQAITKFYKLRSCFVHGDLAIAHPLGNRSLHKEIAVLEDQIIGSSDFAISIVWATLRLLVRERWKDVEFSESFSGLSF